MRAFLLFLCIAFCFCSSAQSDSVTRKFKSLQWLIGSWTGINAKPGISSTEEWRRSSVNTLTGTAFALKDKDTLEIEHLAIVLEGNEMYFVADVRENVAPVKFRMTKVTAQEFICENPEHDFPKSIAYKLVDGTLKATISGNGKSIDYLYKRIN
jgi:hypothetical protein